MSVLEQTTLVLDQGDTGEYVFGPVIVPDPVTGVMGPLDLTQGGMQARFTAKAVITDADVDAKIRKGSPGTTLAGIALNVPASTAKNYGTVTIDPADSEALAAPVSLLFDLQIQEPNGRKTTIRRGVLAIAPDVTNA